MLRGYAGATISIPNLIGSRANITTNNPHLWCEPNASFYTSSIAWTGVTQVGGGGTVGRWAQTGWWKYRLSNNTATNQLIYLEVSVPGVYYYRRYGPAPGAGSHNYQVYLFDPANGRWEARYDGATWAGSVSSPAAGWVCQTANRLDFIGEVHHLQTDMPGIPTNHCSYTNCQYLQASGWTSSGCRPPSSSGAPPAWQNPAIAAGNIFIAPPPPPPRWTAQVISPTALDIWDLCPGTNA